MNSMAYAMGLASEEPPDLLGDDPDLLLEARRLGIKEKPKPVIDSKSLITREIRRRTMWSCFILDRYMSSGRNRPHMPIDTLEIQLPCSEEDWRFGTIGKSERLKAGGGIVKLTEHSNYGHFTQVDALPVLSLYIRLVEIWGGFSKWSCAGGRRSVALKLALIVTSY
jgi:hypothetical protein